VAKATKRNAPGARPGATLVQDRVKRCRGGKVDDTPRAGCGWVMARGGLSDEEYAEVLAPQGGELGHAVDCAWKNAVRDRQERQSAMWARVAERVAEVRAARLEDLRARMAEAEPRERQTTAEEVEAYTAREAEQEAALAEKGQCRNGHDAVEWGSFDPRGSFVCRQCKKEAADRHKAKKAAERKGA
jgi:hypothetical protein